VLYLLSLPGEALLSRLLGRSLALFSLSPLLIASFDPLGLRQEATRAADVVDGDVAGATAFPSSLQGIIRLWIAFGVCRLACKRG
jgi:hypothetical protein